MKEACNGGNQQECRRKQNSCDPVESFFVGKGSSLPNGRRRKCMIASKASGRGKGTDRSAERARARKRPFGPRSSSLDFTVPPNSTTRKAYPRRTQGPVTSSFEMRGPMWRTGNVVGQGTRR